MPTRHFRVIGCAVLTLFLAARADLRAAELVSSLPSNEGSDWFGKDVSISGNTALVMSRHAPPPPDAENWGIGSIFTNVASATGTVTERTRLVIQDDSSFGGVHIDRVSLSGSMALLADSGAGNVGAVYLFRDIINTHGTRHESVKLVPSAQFAFDWEFGAAVSLSQTVALVGAPGNGQDNQRKGCVFIFPNLHTTLAGTVHEHATLVPSDSATAGGGFGRFVHHDGNIGLVGHPFSIDGVNQSTGTAYLYRDLITASGGANITERAKLYASDGVNGDYFGSAVAVSGTTGVVGAHIADREGQSGAAYVFRNLHDVDQGPVMEHLKLVASDGGGAFAFDVSISGKAAIIGAPYRDGSRGAAYLFSDVSAATGTMTESVRVIGTDILEGDEFGYSVSIDGDNFIVGAWQKDEPADDGWRNVGKAYTGSVSSMTILDAGKTSRNIDGLSFVSREDWIVGQTKDLNQVTLFEGDSADVTAPGRAVYVGESTGSDHNTLTIRGHLVTSEVYIGSIGGNANNTFRLDTSATISAAAIRLAPANALALQGDHSTIHSVLARLGATPLQVWRDGAWMTVSAENHESLITIDRSANLTRVYAKAPPPSTADNDGDGMADEWESRYFGNSANAQPGADPDGDGKTNIDEYRAGTSPTDATSLFSIQEPRREASDFVFQFEAAPNKAYEIRSGTDLTGGFPTVERTIPATPTGGIETVTMPLTSARKFYRVVAVP